MTDDRRFCKIIFKYTKGTVLIIQFFIFKKETGMYPVSSL